MNEKCFDSGTMQAFLDGELTPEMSLKFTDHIGVCDDCAIALAESEEETAFVFAALDNEFNALVPTQRLWTKINDSIVEEKKNTPFSQKIWNAVAVLFANPSFAVAAGMLIVFAIFAVFLTSRSEPETLSASVESNQKISAPQINLPENNDKIFASTPKNANDETVQPIQASAKRPFSRESEIRKLVVKTTFNDRKPAKLPVVEPSPNVENANYIPGEESYVKTIATLKQRVDSQKDSSLRPSARISFERDLAVVQDSIDKMKAEVRRNPKNESAKQVLYASYQNKIDLLNSVAERDELMASLK